MKKINITVSNKNKRYIIFNITKKLKYKVISDKCFNKIATWEYNIFDNKKEHYMCEEIFEKVTENELITIMYHEYYHTIPKGIFLFSICKIPLVGDSIIEILADRYACKQVGKKIYLKVLKKYDSIFGYTLGRKLEHGFFPKFRYWIIEKFNK